MLLQLNIKNFALIENLSITFDKGFNVLTGETGAGKSILIDAINYVLGGKFSKDLIRTGEEKTYVEAIFSIENSKTVEVLSNLDIEFDDIIIISRETFQSGKSIAKVNGKSLLLSNIRTIASTILDIHGQHENQNLLDVNNHIFYLDYFAGETINKLLKDYKNKYKNFIEIEQKIQKIQGKEEEKDKLIDFYKYQIDEINKANLKEDEDIILEKEYSILSNAEKINRVLSTCYKILKNNNDSSFSAYDALSIAIKELRGIEKHAEKVKLIADNLESIYYNLEENIEEIRELKDKIQYDEKKLEFINSRIYQISLYKKKYGKTIKEILEYKCRIEDLYNDLINSTEIVEKLKKEKDIILEEIQSLSDKIHEIRKSASIELEKAVKEELNYVGLEKSTFKIEVIKTDNFTDIGKNKVQFLISTNPGEPLRPLEKIVSGGELSRIMLALKTVFIDKDMIPSIIFDEIDVGISGRVAQSVAEKMYILSNKHQVFCVTHLPQIACMSDVHYLISKKTKNNKTYTCVIKMNESEKQNEIARMIGGAEVTKLTIENSKELIKIAELKKMELKNL
ncbi:DNA replication and repair protein RecN [Clostridium sp. USBA 49]|uniref:DNA repair protein RecN n=1 Tax=Clostridium sp. USBA 49 TaxID=1881060 RepID=UPI000999659D|nr:DNA repair protein RecN [Clostridium sp. USBA 49]SKA76748.1 DNA replication and repair protein RecN [Clostridium sp. USBA 49]